MDYSKDKKDESKSYDERTGVYVALCESQGVGKVAAIGSTESPKGPIDFSKQIPEIAQK